MNRSRSILWLALCLLAQAMAATVPQGVTMCIRPVVNIVFEHAVCAEHSGPSEACCCCCGKQNEDTAADCADQPRPIQHGNNTSPCRKPGCTLCLSGPIALPTGGRVLSTQTSGELASFLPAAPLSIAPAHAVCIGGVRMHPWPSAPPPWRPHVGSTILLV